MQIAVLMTCHNRRAKTVASLEALRRAAEHVPGLHTHVFLTDDGSTDGTAEAARRVGLPLTVVPGTGDLYWNRGMVRAWQAAIDSGENHDGFLLLNDDTILDEPALGTLLATNRSLSCEAIVVGAVRDPTSGELTYGGVRRTSHWHPGKVALVDVSDTLRAVDTFNANCVLVPWRVYERVGTLDPAFTHAMGDFDYGLRARRAGMEVVVAPGTVGTCPRNDVAGTWRDLAIPFRGGCACWSRPRAFRGAEWREYLRRHGAPSALVAELDTSRACSRLRALVLAASGGHMKILLFTYACEPGRWKLGGRRTRGVHQTGDRAAITILKRPHAPPQHRPNARGRAIPGLTGPVYRCRTFGDAPVSVCRQYLQSELLA